MGHYIEPKPTGEVVWHPSSSPADPSDGYGLAGFYLSNLIREETVSGAHRAIVLLIAVLVFGTAALMWQITAS